MPGALLSLPHPPRLLGERQGAGGELHALPVALVEAEAQELPELRDPGRLGAARRIKLGLQRLPRCLS